MIEAVRDDVADGLATQRIWRNKRVLTLAAALVVVGAVLGWALVRGVRSERYQVRMLGQALSASAATDELVVIDSRFLGWVLRRQGATSEEAVVMSDHVAPSSLLADLERQRREIVVLAQPGSRLVRTLSAAGYVLVERPGPVAWDVPGKAARLTGWGRYRIFFVRLPKTKLSDGRASDGAVESGMDSGMQHEMK